MLMKNSNDTIGNRTRDLPVCSAVPQENDLVPIVIWGRWALKCPYGSPHLSLTMSQLAGMFVTQVRPTGHINL